jgi:hypothetical protein
VIRIAITEAAFEAVARHPAARQRQLRGGPRAVRRPGETMSDVIPAAGRTGGRR